MRSAERLFLDKGFDPTTIEDITSGAAVSKGAFYLHFSSKADLVEALRSRFVQGLLDRIEEEVGKQADGDWTGKLSAWARACSAGYLDATHLHAILFSAAPPPPRDGLTRNALIDHLAELLIGGNDGSAWSLATPSFTAVFLFNALHGVVNQESLTTNDPARENLLRELEAHFQQVVR